jgi:hypothetical protein
MMQMKWNLAALAVAAAVAGCGGGGGSDARTAPISITVTDAPINTADIEDVCIDFNRITVHYAGGEDVGLMYDPLPAQVTAETHCPNAEWNGMTAWSGTGPVPPVRLSALGGPLTVSLAESLAVPVGRITWIRLHFAGNSYVSLVGGAEEPLRCPSCEPTDNNQERGFKLNRTFEVESGGIAVTVDIDLLKSLHQDGNGYVLRPTARIEVDSTLGTIAGTVDQTLIEAAGGTLSVGGSVEETGCAVYIYEGHDVTPDDYYYLEGPPVEISPVVSTARIKFDLASGHYGYAAGALVSGPYTVAFTCSLDNPEVDDDEMTVVFSDTQNADVVAGQVTAIDF